MLFRSFDPSPRLAVPPSPTPSNLPTIPATKVHAEGSASQDLSLISTAKTDLEAYINGANDDEAPSSTAFSSLPSPSFSTADFST